MLNVALIGAGIRTHLTPLRTVCSIKLRLVVWHGELG